MGRIPAVISLCISGFYIWNILRHMVRPGMNQGYTRMLLFACLATIPLVFMLMMVGGKDRWPLLISQAREMASEGFMMLLLVAGLALLLVLLPLGMLVGIWFGLGLHFGILFILYFAPLVIRLASGTAQASVLAAVTRGCLFFLSFFLAIGLVAILEKFSWGTGTFATHFDLVWPGYRDGVKMFFAISIFALLNQLLEFRHALVAVFSRS